MSIGSHEEILQRYKNILDCLRRDVRGQGILELLHVVTAQVPDVSVPKETEILFVVVEKFFNVALSPQSLLNVLFLAPQPCLCETRKVEPLLLGFDIP